MLHHVMIVLELSGAHSAVVNPTLLFLFFCFSYCSAALTPSFHPPHYASGRRYWYHSCPGDPAAHTHCATGRRKAEASWKSGYGRKAGVFSCIPAHVCFFSLADLRQHLRYLRLATLLHAACHGLCHVPGACGCRCRYAAAARQGDCRNRSPNLTHRSHPTLTLPTPWLPNPLPASHRVSPLPSLFRGEKEKGALLRLRALFPSAIAYVRRTITRINSKIVVFCATNGKWAPSK